MAPGGDHIPMEDTTDVEHDIDVLEDVRERFRPAAESGERPAQKIVTAVDLVMAERRRCLAKRNGAPTYRHARRGR
jgi:hypothetical protein